MQAILKTTDRALVETVRITLEAEGIAVVVQGDSVTALPFIPVTVLVANADAPFATDLVRDLIAPPSFKSQAWSKRWIRLLLVASLILFIIFCGELLIG